MKNKQTKQTNKQTKNTKQKISHDRQYRIIQWCHALSICRDHFVTNNKQKAARSSLAIMRNRTFLSVQSRPNVLSLCLVSCFIAPRHIESILTPVRRWYASLKLMPQSQSNRLSTSEKQTHLMKVCGWINNCLQNSKCLCPKTAATAQKINSYLQCMPERVLSAVASVIDMSLAWACRSAKTKECWMDK